MRRTKRMKLPNGFGQITLLKSNLRKPYRAMITVGVSENGKPICKILKPQGYFETYNDAYMALMENIKNPYDRRKDMTISEIYSKWSKEYYKTLALKTVKNYELAFKKLEEIHNTKIVDIKFIQIKDQIYKLSDTPHMAQYVRGLLNLLFDYAVENEIVEKNYSRLAKIKIESKEAKIIHKAFTDSEMNILLENINNFWVQYILFQCFTGMRPGEICDIKTSNVDLNSNIIIAGSKTKAGINRRIPIHPSIRGLVKRFYYHAIEISSEYLLVTKQDKALNFATYRAAFKDTCDRLGIPHLSHDPRKYFITMAKKYHLDEYAIKLIVGHTITDITESVYTERSNEWLIEEISKIEIPLLYE